MGKHPKQHPSYTPSQCYLVFVGGTGLHVCKNDITIKIPHFKEKSHTWTVTFISLSCNMVCCCLPTLGSTFHCPDDDALHQQVERNYVNTCTCRRKNTTLHLLLLDRSKFWLDIAVKKKQTCSTTAQ